MRNCQAIQIIGLQSNKLSRHVIIYDTSLLLNEVFKLKHSTARPIKPSTAMFHCSDGFKLQLLNSFNTEGGQGGYEIQGGQAGQGSYVCCGDQGGQDFIYKLLYCYRCFFCRKNLSISGSLLYSYTSLQTEQADALAKRCKNAIMSPKYLDFLPVLQISDISASLPNQVISVSLMETYILHLLLNKQCQTAIALKREKKVRLS